MKAKIFAIYDSKAEAYMRPFVAQSSGAAIRAFSDEVNSDRDGSQVSSHPEDYTLFELATWNELTGEVVVLSPKNALINGLDCKRVEPVQLKEAR